jgi:hypothetical protein
MSDKTCEEEFSPFKPKYILKHGLHNISSQSNIHKALDDKLMKAGYEREHRSYISPSHYLKEIKRVDSSELF